MLTCELCKQRHLGTYGSGRFCSSICAHCYSTKDKRQEINKIVSVKLKGRPAWSSGGFKTGYDPKRAKLTTEKYKEIAKKGHEGKRRKRLERWSHMKWEDLPETERKRQVTEEQGKKCLCGLSEWNGQRLSLELHHIDGDTKNGRRDNLEVLCPNCHSITKNYRGRGGKPKKFDKREFMIAVEECQTMHQILKRLGMRPKGANYSTIRKRLEEIGMLWKFQKF